MPPSHQEVTRLVPSSIGVAIRLIYTLTFLALTASCASTRDYFGIYITRYPERDGGDAQGEIVVGMWEWGKLNMDYSETALRFGHQESALPITTDELQRVIGWVLTPKSLPCEDGSVFEHGKRLGNWAVHSINVYPRGADLVVTTYWSAPGPAKSYFFQKNGSDFICTKAEAGDIMVTS